MIARPRRRVLLAGLFVVMVAGPAASQALPYPLRFHDAEIEVDQAKTDLAKWQGEARAAEACAIAIALLGAITLILQKVNRPWTSFVTGFAGALVTIVTAVNAVFVPADFKTLRKQVDKGGGYVKKMDEWIQWKASTDQEHEYALSRILWYVARFQTIAAGDASPAINAAINLPSLGTVVHAQGRPDCSCSKLQPTAKGDLTYGCGTATADSLTAAHEQAVANALSALAARLDGRAGRTAEQNAASVDYVRRVASEADSCASAGKDASVTVLLEMPARLAEKTAQTAFVPNAPAPQTKVPNAGGEIAVIPATSRNLQIPVKAAPAKYGDFVFTFAISPGNPRVMQLQTIKVIQDGSAGQTKWSFSMFLDGQVVATLPEQNYSDSGPAMYRMTSAIALPVAPAARITVLGYRR